MSAFAIRKWLLDDSEINALVGGRIYAFELPDTEADDMPRKVILINDAGSGLQDSSYRNIDWTLKDIRCHGETMYESTVVYDTVKAKLKALKRTLITGMVDAQLNPLPDIFLYSAVPVAGRFTSREPDTDWPTSFGTFNIMVSED
jgi:hypothetical protein